jgi:hypothetical protein
MITKLESSRAFIHLISQIAIILIFYEIKGFDLAHFFSGNILVVTCTPFALPVKS